MTEARVSATGPHPGIELRFTTPAGVVMQGNSDFYHLQAKIAGSGWAAPADGWAEMLRTVEGLVIEYRAVTLDNTPWEEEG